MDDEIRRVEAQIEAVSQAIDGLYALQEAGVASFDSAKEGKLQYLMKEKQDLRKKEEALRKKEEDLRKKELLLLEISKNEWESKALIYSLQYSTKVIIIVILTQSKISL